MSTPRNLLTASLLLAATVALAGCAGTTTHSPLTADAYRATSLRDIYPHRFWGDEAPRNLEVAMRARAPMLRELYRGAEGADPKSAPFSRLLAISGGGADGAFGAGLLAGWTESGERVDFEVVTGVSTGAIIAPFAFLGPEYDAKLVRLYTTIDREKIFELDLVQGLLFGSAATDTAPLRRQLARHITPELVAAIGREHERGRSLFVITTHFDARRPVVWDIGAIARRGDDGAVALIRQVILASAAIPGLFPPVTIEFERGGQRFTEMHVDGGVSHNVFAYPAQISMHQLDEILGLTLRREIYVIRNSNFEFPYRPATARTLSLARRALDTLLRNQGSGDIERIYHLARRDGVAFRLASIPDTFVADGGTDFDGAYMRSLIELGRQIGRSGTFWQRRPPTLETDE